MTHTIYDSSLHRRFQNTFSSYHLHNTDLTAVKFKKIPNHYLCTTVSFLACYYYKVPSNQLKYITMPQFSVTTAMWPNPVHNESDCIQQGLHLVWKSS